MLLDPVHTQVSRREVGVPWFVLDINAMVDGSYTGALVRAGFKTSGNAYKLIAR